LVVGCESAAYQNKAVYRGGWWRWDWWLWGLVLAPAVINASLDSFLRHTEGWGLFCSCDGGCSRFLMVGPLGGVD
jgi:hypothetical protein